MGKLELQPREGAPSAQDHPDGLNDLGIALMHQGRMDEAIAMYRRAIEQRRAFPHAWTNLGTALQAKGQLDEAIVAHQTAVQLRGDFAVAHTNLGRALFFRGRVDEAIASYRTAIALRQLGSVVHNNLGDALLAGGRVEEALEVRRDAVARFPDCPDAANNLANLVKDLGLLDEAIAAFRRAIALRPDPCIHSNLLLALNYDDKIDAAQLKREHDRFAELYERPLLALHRPYDLVADPDRKLRIGYVSPDLREHPVGLFIEPILAHHNRERFEVFCYSTSGIDDSITARLKLKSDRWIEARDLSDDQLAAKIREDKIDILIDLSGHTAGHRLLVFARKPAPIQATYLGYSSTTGLKSIEFTMTNRYLLPEANTQHYSGRPLRLPNSYWCYQPRPETPEVSPLPALTNGYVTFGCLNNLAKVGKGALDAWAKILKRVPDSHLLLLASVNSRREAISEYFAAQNIASQRLEFVSKQPISEYFSTISRIDIALDPFPHNGGTTTIDSLWMGVPVITFPGELSIARVGLSLLASAGLGELVAEGVTGYIDLACELSADISQLAKLRATLRERVAASPVADAKLVTRDLEEALRGVWREWCDARQRQA